MSIKCKRLNKTTTNHYHDSGSSVQLNCSRTTNSTGTFIRQHHHIHLREPPLFELEQKRTLGQDHLTLSVIRHNKNRKMDTSHEQSLLVVGMKRQQQPKTIYINFNINNTKILAFLSILITFFLLLSSIDGVQSLNCYTCSSADNPGCDEAFTGRANITDTDCEKQIGRPAKVCRKLVQYIEHKKVVIRSCGYIDEHEEKDKKAMCYKRSGTFAIMMESCICYEDNCNHSASLVPNQIITLLLSGLISISMIYIFRE